jgi:hypothetical protein
MRLFRTGGLYLGTGTVTDPGVGCLNLAGTTASTSTTTGALQVAGGVGVAGALFVGGTVRSNSSTAFTSQTDLRNTVQFQASTSDAITRAGYLVRGGSGNNDWYLLGDTQGGTQLFRIGTAADAVLTDHLTINRGTGTLTIGGAIATSAPTGGAGAWELGVANTVTPTAPDRTITIEIGGTVYYLHAKTTND